MCQSLLLCRLTSYDNPQRVSRLEVKPSAASESHTITRGQNPHFGLHLFHSGENSLFTPVAMSRKALDVRAPGRSGRLLWEMSSEKGKEAETRKSTMKCSRLWPALPGLSFFKHLEMAFCTEIPFLVCHAWLDQGKVLENGLILC